MKIEADCIPCLMKRVLFQSRLIEGTDDYHIVESSLKTFASEIGAERKSVDVATEVHRTCYSCLGSRDPYHDLKVEADSVAERFMPIAQAMVDSSDDKLRAALMVSVVGNIMDFGSGIAIDDPSEFEHMFDDLVAQGIGCDDSDVIEECLRRDGGVVYIFDNCGESQLDRILIRYLRSKGKRVVGVVRGEPILNDVTMEDAVRTGLDGDLDALMTTGKYYVGIDWPDVPDDLRKEIAGACLVIAKGMANYESLSDEDLGVPVAHVLRSKCRPVSESLGVPMGINVVRVRNFTGGC